MKMYHICSRQRRKMSAMAWTCTSGLFWLLVLCLLTPFAKGNKVKISSYLRKNLFVVRIFYLYSILMFAFVSHISLKNKITRHFFNLFAMKICKDHLTSS